MKLVTFTRIETGFIHNGEPDFEHGIFQYLKNGLWQGTGLVEPIADLMKRMAHDPAYYKYPAYRILEVVSPTALDIKVTCGHCGVIAGVDCQRACESVFGAARVTRELPIEFDEDHQFVIDVTERVQGKHVTKTRTRKLTFNSIRCAELYLAQAGLVPEMDEQFGSGARLAKYLSPEIKTRSVKRQRASRKAKELVWAVPMPVSAHLESIA